MSIEYIPNLKCSCGRRYWVPGMLDVCRQSGHKGEHLPVCPVEVDPLVSSLPVKEETDFVESPRAVCMPPAMGAAYGTAQDQVSGQGMEVSYAEFSKQLLEKLAAANSLSFDKMEPRLGISWPDQAEGRLKRNMTHVDFETQPEQKAEGLLAEALSVNDSVLTGLWFAKNKNGSWHTFEDEPICFPEKSCWIPKGGPKHSTTKRLAWRKKTPGDEWSHALFRKTVGGFDWLGTQFCSPERYRKD